MVDGKTRHLGCCDSPEDAARAYNAAASANTLDGVACPRPSTCFAVGATGTILRSTDGRSTWRGV